MLLFSVSPTNSFAQVNDTRVILQNADADVVGSDYINANYLRVSLQCHWPLSNKQNCQIFCFSSFMTLLVFKVIVVVELSLCVCRTPCGRPQIRKFTLPLRGV